MRSDLLRVFRAGGPKGEISLDEALDRLGSLPHALRILAPLIEGQSIECSRREGRRYLIADVREYEIALRQKDAFDAPGTFPPHHARRGGVPLQQLPAVVEMQHRRPDLEPVSNGESAVEDLVQQALAQKGGRP